MALGRRRRERQLEAFVVASDLPKSPGHPSPGTVTSAQEAAIEAGIKDLPFRGRPRSSRRTPRSSNGFRRPAATTTGMADPSFPRPSIGQFAASGR